MEKEKVEHMRVSKNKQGVRFEIISVKGTRKYNGNIFNKKEDRLFKIRLVDKDGKSVEYPYTYSDVFRLTECILDNIILDHVYEREKQALLSLFEIMDKQRKNKEQKTL